MLKINTMYTFFSFIFVLFYFQAILYGTKLNPYDSTSREKEIEHKVRFQ